MADDDYLARDKADKGRFTLTPEERKLRRQTAEADRKIRREIPAVDPDVPQQEGPGLPGPSRNPLEKDVPETASYAKGGQVGRVGSFGLKRSKPDFAGGGGINNFKSWGKKNA
jgi:hypothetical protein